MQKSLKTTNHPAAILRVVLCMLNVSISGYKTQNRGHLATIRQVGHKCGNKSDKLSLERASVTGC